MTVETLLQNGFNAIHIADGTREIHGAYIGDLLSWVMGRGTEDEAWITIMSNPNVIAVASLINFSCVILSESVDLSDEVLALAKAKEINILSFSGSSYDAAVALSGLSA